MGKSSTPGACRERSKRCTEAQGLRGMTCVFTQKLKAFKGWK